MLFRLVRPVQHAGSRNSYFARRIPADLKSRIVAPDILLGGETHRVIIRAGANDVCFSLRAIDSAQVKVRQARAAACLETSGKRCGTMRRPH
jgi:hypothetical protein